MPALSDDDRTSKMNPDCCRLSRHEFEHDRRILLNSLLRILSYPTSPRPAQIPSSILMKGKQVARSNSPAESAYNMDDTFVLTQEEEEALSRIEERHQVAQSSPISAPRSAPNTPTTSPSRKKRKRLPSSDYTPHTSPYKLRSLVKRALDAGQNSNVAPLPTSLPSNASVAAPPAGESNHTKPAVAKLSIQKDDNLTSSDAKVDCAELQASISDSGSRSESLGPVNSLRMPSGAMYHPTSAMNHNGQSGPIPYQPYSFQPYQMPYVTTQGFLFHNHPMQRNNGPIMPTEGPNPTSNVFSAQYAPPAPPPQSEVPVSGSSNATAACTSFLPDALPHTASSPVPSLQTKSNGASKDQGGGESYDHAATNLRLKGQGADTVSEERDQSDSSLDQSPTVGRLSNASRDALRNGFDELDALLKRISGRTGLTTVQIIERWDVKKTRATSSWNIYQGFFEERRDCELGRLPPEERTVAGAIPDKSIISACYERFKAAKPDSFDEILRTWHRLRLLSDGEMSVSKRAREFKKHVEKFDGLIRHASNLYGFETICITVGGVVNQDQNLAQIVASKAATDFFLDRFRSTDSVTLGQMKTHVYDRLSRGITDEYFPPVDTQASSAIAGNGNAIPNASIIKSKDSSTSAGAGGDSNVLAELKERFIALAAKHDIVLTKGSSLHWKGLPQIVAEAGCVLVNWPEDVSFPCDDGGGRSTSKGIAILKIPARMQLLAAFDHPVHPLHIEKRYSSAVPKSHPVIFGVPPDSTSPHAFGRRKFLDSNQNEDRKGPPRCKPPSSSHSRRAPNPKAPSRTAHKRASQPVEESESSSDEDMPLVVSDTSEDAETPKAPKKTAKHPSKVHFKNEPQDSPYSMSLEGSPQYSGSDREIVSMPRSPLNLRSKASARKLDKRIPASIKEPNRRQTRVEGNCPATGLSKKKGTLEESLPTSSSLVVIEAPRSSAVDKEANAADVVAEMLFGGPNSKSASQSANAEVPHHREGTGTTVIQQPEPRPPQDAMPPPLHHPRHAAMPLPLQAHHAMPPLQHLTTEQQSTHQTRNPAHAVIPGYPEGYYQPAPSNYASQFPNATPYGTHPHSQMWYPPPSSSSSSSLPGATGPAYPGHPNGNFWPNQGPPMMYSPFGHYPSHPQHMPLPPKHNGLDAEPSG